MGGFLFLLTCASSGPCHLGIYVSQGPPVGREQPPQTRSHFDLWQIAELSYIAWQGASEVHLKRTPWKLLDVLVVDAEAQQLLWGDALPAQMPHRNLRLPQNDNAAHGRNLMR